MYPEGTLINFKKFNLIVFEKDTNNPLNEGFIFLWDIKKTNEKQLIFKQRLIKEKAKIKWQLLIDEGWPEINEFNWAA